MATTDTTASGSTGAGEWGGQEFVRATVHLAGPVEIETGHAAHYAAAHVQARIGPALLYFLDYVAARDFAAAVADAAAKAAVARLFSPEGAALPPGLGGSDQESSVIVRLRGRQQVVAPQAVAGAVSPHRQPFLTCQLGGLVLVLHSAEALARLVTVAYTAHRVAAALWPQAARRVHDVGPDDGRDIHAEHWEQTHRPG